MVTITKQQADGWKHEAFVDWVLPHGWIVRKQTPDIFVDFRVEIVEAGEPTGTHVLLQVRGKSKKRVRDITVKTKQLRYFHEKCTDPVFLVVRDGTDAAYFFVQRWIDEEGLPTARSRRVRIDWSKLLSDSGAFRAAVADAFAYLRRRTAPTAVDAVRLEEAFLGGLDHRFRVAISASNAGRMIRLEALEDVQGRMSLVPAGDPQKAFEQLRRTMDFGCVARLPMASLTLTGSPLLEHLATGIAGELVLGPCSRERVVARLQTRGGHEVTLFGELTRGRRGCAVDAAFAGGAFALHAEFTVADRHLSCDVDLSLSPRQWRGTQVTSLDVLPALRTFLADVRTAPDLVLRLENDNGLSARLDVSEIAVRAADDWFRVIDVLDALRLIGRHTGRPIAYPDFAKTSDVELRDIQLAGDLLRDQVAVREAVPLRVSHADDLEPRVTQLFALGTAQHFVVETSLTVELAATVIAELPIEARWEHYVPIVKEPGDLRLAPAEGAQHVIRLMGSRAQAA